MRKPIKNICCIGAGYVGGPTCAVIANKNPNIDVTVVDFNKEKIDAWNSANLPIYEPGLYDTVELPRDGTSARAPNLFFSTDVDEAIKEADLIFISVNTPTKLLGVGAGRATDVTFVEAAARQIAEVAVSDKIIVEKSTVPCGTANTLREVFESLGDPTVNFEVLSNPEFLAEGTAINDLLSPERILIGSSESKGALEAARMLADVYASWIPQERILTINIWSSELAKLAANCLLAQRISSINSLSALCEAVGADINEVSRTVGLDQRIGPKFLKASVGFGGSCFKKDVLNLVYMAETLHLPEVAAYWKSVVDINEWQKERFTKRIIAALHNTLSGKKVAVLGLAYKKDTGDIRESPAIGCIGQMIAENSKVAIYDPKVKEAEIIQILKECHGSQAVDRCVTFYENAYSACSNAAAVVILTEWDQFKTDSFAPSEPLRPRELQNMRTEDQSRIVHAHSDSTLEHSDSDADLMDDQASKSHRTSPDTSVTSLSSSPKSETHTPTDLSSKRLDWYRLSRLMRRPRLVFDGRNVVDPVKLASLGFVVHCIGK